MFEVAGGLLTNRSIAILQKDRWDELTSNFSLGLHLKLVMKEHS